MNDPQDLTPPDEEKRDPRDGRTPEDIKNGWSFEAWLQYHQERTSAAAEKIDPLHPNRRVRPSRANGLSSFPNSSSRPFAVDGFQFSPGVAVFTYNIYCRQ